MFLLNNNAIIGQQMKTYVSCFSDVSGDLKQFSDLAKIQLRWTQAFLIIIWAVLHMHILLLVHENFWRICVSFFVSKEIFGKTSEAKLIPKQNLSENSLTSPAMKAQPLSSEIVPRGYYVIWTNTHLKALCCSSTVLLLLLTHNPPESPHHALR